MVSKHKTIVLTSRRSEAGYVYMNEIEHQGMLNIEEKSAQTAYFPLPNPEQPAAHFICKENFWQLLSFYSSNGSRGPIEVYF